MKTKKGCAVILIAAIAIVAAVTAGIGNASGIEAWFIQGTIDRVNPLTVQATAYARMPDSDAYFDSYTDASGNGENYVYEIRVYDENGADHTVNLVSFGDKLDDEADGYLKLTVKGSYVRRWKPVGPDAVPAAATQALG